MSTSLNIMANISPTKPEVDLVSRGDPSPKKRTRNFPCPSPGCGRRFATAASCRAHQARCHSQHLPKQQDHQQTDPEHDPLRPHTCSVCGKRFKSCGDLHKHSRTHTGERPFQCDFAACGKRFTTANILKVHRRTHTGERPYKCPVCGKSFASHTNLKNHGRLHSGERPFVCERPDCGRRFAEYSALFKHQLVHSPAQHPCPECGKGYRLRSTLALHMKTAHDRDMEETAENAKEEGEKAAQDEGGDGEMSLSGHLQPLSPEPLLPVISHVCHLCTVECSDTRALQEHMVRVHGSPAADIFAADTSVPSQNAAGCGLDMSGVSREEFCESSVPSSELSLLDSNCDLFKEFSLDTLDSAQFVFLDSQV